MVEIEAVKILSSNACRAGSQRGRARQIAPVALRAEANRARPQNLRRLEHPEHHLRWASGVTRIHHLVEGPLHILRRDRSAVAPCGGLIKLKGIGELIVGDRPALGEIRHELRGERVHTQQRLIHHAEHLTGIGVVIDVGIQAFRWLKRRKADHAARFSVRAGQRIRRIPPLRSGIHIVRPRQQQRGTRTNESKQIHGFYKDG